MTGHMTAHVMARENEKGAERGHTQDQRNVASGNSYPNQEPPCYRQKQEIVATGQLQMSREDARQRDAVVSFMFFHFPQASRKNLLPSNMSVKRDSCRYGRRSPM